MNISIIRPLTEQKILSAIGCYKTKTHFDMCVELYKLGMISREEFIRRTQMDIVFNPEKTNPES